MTQTTGVPTDPPPAAPAAARLVVAALRLPIEAVDDGTGEPTWRRAPGGLVSALEPVLRDGTATWVGWLGRSTDEDGPTPATPPDSTGDLRLEPVELDPGAVESFYEGFCNGTLWPLYHNGIATPAYHRSHFAAYHAVNDAFARRIAAIAAPGATVWVHDYQLQLVPRMLRTLRPDLRIGFFLHIPFPPLELFSQLPWRRQVLDGLLGADLVAFQTPQGVGNFLAAVQRYLGLDVVGDRVPQEERAGVRTTLVRAEPIGIDAAAYSRLAADPLVRARSREIRRELGDPRRLVVGVDRLDYTKGIDVRIRAFTELIAERADDDQTTVLLQVAVPSRENVLAYQSIRDDVELLVGRANGDLGGIGYRPVHYLHQAMDTAELVAVYLAADVMLVTPLCDGMNLVCKEYVATRLDDTGALVLSEFTGAAVQMTQAWLVNPYDIDGLKATLDDALHADGPELRRRMAPLRAGVHAEDVSWWAHRFLRTLHEEE